ncbi:phenylacetic acid degradation protein PaaN [Bordetella genomosp. 9]|uniref:phenylacetic acid degradation protein PaaN n=1 Tax=Bordetella genomosp. 9 TaxID=1416803 RepID=UPI000A290C6A|nr:phenylacetic acid degradation protein PaaN [Bordetella genomosp. 9]ARP90015.1 phenylacetic acid degradation protein PaaN [Bordetella genomosp. 9]
MTQDFFERHRALLEDAVRATETRAYWSPYPESPSPRNYGDTANEQGRQAFDALREGDFPMDIAGAGRMASHERSPYGLALQIRYPHLSADALVAASSRALAQWRRAGPRAWVGVSLEILSRLNRASFEIAHAVQHTTGQGFMMAFQAGGPHAQDRGLEAVAYAWREMSRIPERVLWEKPQGKQDPLRMEKRFTIVPRGVALVIGCSTFPTWNGYPGLFASLATGNTVIVKPHPTAILPLAITVRIARDVLQEAGFDPDVLLLAAHAPPEETGQTLATHPDVRIVDFTGSKTNGEWLERHAAQAQVYTEKSGVNPVVLDSVEDLKAAARNLAFSLALYSGQMCTAPQNIYVPRAGIPTAQGRASFDDVAAAIADALQALTADEAKAAELLGAIQSEATLARLDAASALGLPVLAQSRPLAHPQFPDARIRTPLLLRADADHPDIQREWFGPIAIVVQVASTDQAIALARDGAREHGALTWSAYTTDPDVARRAQEAAEDAGVSLSLNLTRGVFVNQSAAFSDFHGTGANPAANASLCDSAFVANRFRVVQTRWHA